MRSAIPASKANNRRNEMNADENQNPPNKTEGVAGIGCTDGLGARPLSRLPSGKVNPEYTRWYRRMKPESVTNYNHSEKAKACRARHYSKAQAAMHDNGKVTPRNECKCVECGMTYKRDDAILRGFRFLKTAGNKVVCDECA
jgi:hypothetical protein